MRIGYFLGISLLIALLSGCHSAPETKLYRFEFQQPHMGTMFTIALYAPYQTKGRQASDAAFARVAELDRMMSDYDPESELMLLLQKASRSAGTCE
jgi:thiamine biosynthesis lipoprotein